MCCGLLQVRQFIEMINGTESEVRNLSKYNNVSGGGESPAQIAGTSSKVRLEVIILQTIFCQLCFIANYVAINRFILSVKASHKAVYSYCTFMSNKSSTFIMKPYYIHPAR